MMSNSIGKLVRRSRLLRVLFYPAFALRRAVQQSRYQIQSRVLDNLANQLSEDPVLRVAEFGGSFRVGKESDVLRRLLSAGHYEPELARLCLSLLAPGRDAIDVGANIGFYTVFMASHMQSNKVLSIEPTSSALTRLKDNVIRNDVQSRVIIFEGAVSDTAGVLGLNVIQGREEYSSLGTMVHPSVQGAKVDRQEVVVKTVDELVLQHGLDVGFVKMDVEGLEMHVLKGMERVLQRYKPVLICELNDPQLRQNGSSAHELIAWLQAAGYQVSDPFDPRMTPGRKAFGEILCVPEQGR